MKNKVGRPAQNTFDVSLSTVHDALVEARDLNENPDHMENTTIRISARKKKMLVRICQIQGTTISDYLRACADALIRDYAGPKTFAEIENSPEQPS